ncbi:membrane protein [Dyella thiooxydans]|uniref:Membrane protein n=1 Tax=Dyella thiooxydans TaxID=445710 RepID=A0A160N1W1_9GAMM|nr:EamA family transporter [Dyella thiooxydans]AND69202.1 membrane protein [Dyella thiooxydans]
MPLLTVALWLSNALLDTGGQLAFKAAAADPAAGDGAARWKYMAARPWLWIGIGCYVFEFLVWIAFLSLVQASEGVLLGSINIVVIMVAGRFLFGEKLTRLRVAGILLVSIGVAVVGAGA